jgi:hypothetical protein
MTTHYNTLSQGNKEGFINIWISIIYNLSETKRKCVEICPQKNRGRVTTSLVNVN